MLIISILLISTASFSENLRSVLNWNPNIPASSKSVLELVEAEAAYFSFETDQDICGGEISQPILLNYKSFTTEDGNEIHEFIIRTHVTKSENYCQSETVLTCMAPIQVLSSKGILMGDWTCED